MGSGICKNLIDKGNVLTVYDCNKVALERFEGIARLAKNSFEVYENSDVIFLSLPNSEAVEEIVNEYLEAGVKGKTVVDLSTSFPLSTRRLYKKFKQQKGNFIDAPLNAGPEEAKEGKLISMVAGDKKAIDEISDLLDCYCKEYSYLGESGNAHIAKVAMNFIGLMYAVLLSQMFPLVEKLGIDPRELFKTMDNDIFSNWMYRFYGPKIVDRNYKVDFKLGLGLKDLTYMRKLYDEFNVPSFTLDGAIDLLRTAVKDGKSDEDFSQCAATIYDFLKL
jgi:3-hydroxyisobutyrate dehydrogenase-like beta-hydroxyacid dehydrogenase